MQEAVRQVRLMGTIITLTIYHTNSEALLVEAEARLRDYEQRFSAHAADSDLMRVNQQAGLQAVPVAADMFELIRIGKKMSLASDGALNIAIGPLMKLWHIGFEDAQVPSQAEIEQALQLIDPRRIQLDAASQTVYLEVAGMELDLGAVAKGYFADLLKSFFVEQGVEAGIINLGGNVLTIGNSPKNPLGTWNIGIQNPEAPRGDLLALAQVRDQSVVTSGIYERKLVVDGQEYHHIFDSRTGYPVANEIASVTIVSDKSIDGELWTTVLFVHSPERALALIEATPGIEALIITKDLQQYPSTGMRDILHYFS